MARTLALIIFSTLLFAGCVDVLPEGDDVVPTGASNAALACFGDACNFEATTTNTEGNEVTVAVDPTDPLTIVAAAKDYTPETAGDCVWVGIYVTQDGGRTWTNTHVPGSPHLLTSNPANFTESPASQFWCTTDPVLAFGPDGTCYLAFMAYQADPVTSSKLGAGVLPQGGLNDWAFNRAAQMVGASDDGCLTFDHITSVADGSYPVNFHDKAWIAVGADGAVHIAWPTFGPTLTNNYYRSTDGGRTWAGPQVLGQSLINGDDSPLSEAPAGQGTVITVGNGGKDVFVAWGEGAPGLYMARSRDGGATFEPARVVIEAEDEDMEATYRSGGMPFFAADDSPASPHRGNLYAAWQDTRAGDRDIWFSVSADAGDTWSEPVMVSDAPAGTDQFFPAMSVGPDGVIDVTFYDRRLDPDATMLDLYYAHSQDGGLTWSPNARVTTVSSDPNDSHHQNGMVFIGDYIDLDSSAGAAHPVWVDTRNGVADVYVATLLRGPLAEAALPPDSQSSPTPEASP